MTRNLNLFYTTCNSITKAEYLAKKTNTKNYAMLIYNKNLSVSPVTTHIPLKKVSTSITIKKIVSNTILIKKFYKNKFKKNARIAITGINPHCESNLKNNEEKNEKAKENTSVLSK